MLVLRTNHHSYSVGSYPSTSCEFVGSLSFLHMLHVYVICICYMYMLYVICYMYMLYVYVYVICIYVYVICICYMYMLYVYVICKPMVLNVVTSPYG